MTIQYNKAVGRAVTSQKSSSVFTSRIRRVVFLKQMSLVRHSPECRVQVTRIVSRSKDYNFYCAQFKSVHCMCSVGHIWKNVSGAGHCIWSTNVNYGSQHGAL